MPRGKDLKRLTRSRMAKTGEAYTSARARLLEKKPRKASLGEYAERAGISDEAVNRATGRTWKRWVGALDAVGAFDMKHRDIARHVADEYGVGAWWAQSVTVGYERIHGLREKGQRRGGGYEVNKSKTIAVPIGALYKAVATKRQRRRWLGDVELDVRESTTDKSIRMLWCDGSPVEAYFWAKGESKSQIQLQHRKLPTKAAAERMRKFWTERLGALTQVLRS